MSDSDGQVQDPKPDESGTASAEVDLKKYAPIAEFLKVKEVAQAATRELEQLKQEQAEEARKRQEAAMSAEEKAAAAMKERDILAEKLTGIEQQAKADAEARQAKLLAKIPEDKREKYKEFSVNQLEILVDEFEQLTQGAGLPGGKPGGDAGGEYGGYSSWTEYAQKDPAGAAKAMAVSGSQSIPWG